MSEATISRDEWLAALDAMPNVGGPWTAEQDADLCRFWGKKPKEQVMRFMLDVHGRDAGAVEARVPRLRARGKQLGRYIAAKRRH